MKARLTDRQGWLREENYFAMLETATKTKVETALGAVGENSSSTDSKGKAGTKKSK